MVIVFKMKDLIMSNFGKTPMPSLLKSVSCVTFFSESLEPIFIFPRPLDEQEYWKTWMPLKILCFGRKKEPEEIDKQKKYAQWTRWKLFVFTTEAAEVKRAGGNEKIARFDRSVRSSVKWNILEQGFNRARLCFLCFTHSFNDLICYLSDLFLPNGCRKFCENKANRVEKHDHFSLHKNCFVIIYSAHL